MGGVSFQLATQCRYGRRVAQSQHNGNKLAPKVASFGVQNEVVVSSTVKDLVAYSGLHFIAKSMAHLSDELPEANLFRVKT